MAPDAAQASGASGRVRDAMIKPLMDRRNYRIFELPNGMLCM